MTDYFHSSYSRLNHINKLFQNNTRISYTKFSINFVIASSTVSEKSYMFSVLALLISVSTSVVCSIVTVHSLIANNSLVIIDSRQIDHRFHLSKMYHGSKFVRRIDILYGRRRQYKFIIYLPTLQVAALLVLTTHWYVRLYSQSNIKKNISLT